MQAEPWLWISIVHCSVTVDRIEAPFLLLDVSVNVKFRSYRSRWPSTVSKCVSIEARTQAPRSLAPLERQMAQAVGGQAAALALIQVRRSFADRMRSRALLNTLRQVAVSVFRL